ncbi:MAG: DUF4384 domain-containing protein [Sphingobacteriia bacterium]|nr:MAG: DUF4384 domain-containing protein [Sphingobacteriia bacterium]TAH06609.1 MAG: DUF4384 domain-containing protein [Sphingobacteriia bacterium]
MKRIKKSLLLVLVICSSISLNAQKKRGLGEVIDLDLIAKTPQKMQISERSFANLPTSVSLEKYAPTPGDQGEYGTCTAWAVGYGVATILYAKTHGLTDKALINKYAFSPSFLYEQIKDSSDNNCQGGSSSVKALITLISTGDATLRTVPYTCGIKASANAKTEASDYKIGDVAILFAAKGLSKEDKYFKQEAEAIDLTKKALMEGSPISISYTLPKSFFAISSAVWTPDPSENFGDWKHSSHAMCVIGYDDNIAGGAFRVMNSWGANWGDKGFVWIRYADFYRWCQIALQPFGNPYSKAPSEKKEEPVPKPAPLPAPNPTPSPVPTPTPTPKPSPASDNIFVLGGSVELKLNDGTNMEASKISTRNLVVDEEKAESEKEALVAYRVNDKYASGTKFRFYIKTDEEAYIYAFASDLTGKVNLLLPFDDMVSTHIGANTTVAFPSDKKVIKMDEQRGTDYLLIIYSREQLNVKNMLVIMNAMSGSLRKKIKAVLADKLIDKDFIKYDANKPGFQVAGKKGSRNLVVSDDKSDNRNTTGTVVPLMIEISHQ